MNLHLQGRKALVTGGDSGIGYATAKLLLKEGAAVVITSPDQDKLERAAQQLSSEGKQLHAFTADVTDIDSLESLKSQVQKATGDIDILVQAAGITGAQGPFHEIDDNGWFKTINVNLLGPVRLARIFLPPMINSGWGRIIFTASEDAQQPYPNETPYCAAKAGLLALSKGLSKAYARGGILINSVSPAFIATPMTDAMMKDRAEKRGTTIEEAIESFLAEERPHIALKRRGKAEEVANVIAFLCSERASFVNGANYRVDAGSVASI
jgi:NAD(P)-dependent dehydrogenase (short-subunit alcohol dehydrogenase family)